MKNSFSKTLIQPLSLGYAWYVLAGLLIIPFVSEAQTTEAYETEIVGSQAFSEGGLSFIVTGDLDIEDATGFGCCPSNRYLATGVGDGLTSGSAGQVLLTTFGKGFQLQELDAWTSMDDGGNFAAGDVTFIGIRPNGTTVSETITVNPTGQGGADYEHISFAGTALDGINLIGVEFVLDIAVGYIAIDNFKFLSVDIPTVTINDVSIMEGNAGTQLLMFTATLTNAASGPFSISYSTGDNTATTGDMDYVTASGMLNFSGTHLETETLNVTINGDTQFEADETFFVNLGNASLAGVRVFDSQGQGTIQNDDNGSSLGITAANATKLEGNSGNTPFFFTVTRGVDLSGTTTVDYTVSGSGGNPANAADFGGSFPSGTITFIPGESAKSLQINVIGDVTDENNEAFTVTLSNNSMGSAITTPSATGTILDDDMILETFETEVNGMAFSESGSNFTTTGNVSVATTATLGCCPSDKYLQSIGSGNVGAIQFTNTGIGGFILQEMDVWTSANGGSANASGNVTFTGTRPDGTTAMHTFTIMPTGNAGTDFHHISFSGTPLANQVLRSVAMNVAAPLNFAQYDNIKFGLGNQGVVSINDVSLTEGDGGSQNLVFTVTHTGTSSAFSVNYATANNSATAGSDYTSTSGMLNFNGTNNQMLTISVPVSGDMLVELNETFFVNLTSISNPAVALQDGQGLGTINNNDAALITINDVSMNEGNSGTTNFVFTATLDKAVNTSVTVNYATANGTAIAGSDYTMNSGSISFSGTANEMEIITIAVSGDMTFEPNETFFVNLSNIQAGGRSVSFSDMQGLGTILNDDANPVPEIAVSGNGNPINDGAGAGAVSATNDTDFGSACVSGGTVTHTFTITNEGMQDLILDGVPAVALTGHTTDFTVTLQPTSPVPGGSSTTTFQVEFNPTTTGVRTVTVSIDNNDSNEDPFDFVIQGTGIDVPVVSVHPTSKSVCPNIMDSFSASAMGTPTPTLQWQVSTDGGMNWSNIGGATSSPYTFTAMASDDGNQYRAVFTNTCGADTSDVATLTVNVEDPSFSYSTSSYCQAGTDPLPTVTGTTGGIFSAPAQVVINSVTGEIDLSASTAGGPYMVTYNTNGACPQSSTFDISIEICQPSAMLTDAFAVDNNMNNIVDGGDVLLMTAKISNSNSADYEVVKLVLGTDPNLNLVSGSFKSTPVAVNDSYTATQDVALNIMIGSGVLQNDFDDNIPGLMVTSHDAMSSNGGTVTVNADGSFTYNPPSGYTGPDSFTYTITDSDTQNDTATVSISVQ